AFGSEVKVAGAGEGEIAHVLKLGELRIELAEVDRAGQIKAGKRRSAALGSGEGAGEVDGDVAQVRDRAAAGDGGNAGVEVDRVEFHRLAGIGARDFNIELGELHDGAIVR